MVTAALVIGAVTVAVAAGVVALLAAALVTARPVLFAPAGIVAFLVVDAAGAALVVRRAPPSRRPAAGSWLFFASAGLVLVLFTLTALIPPAVITSPPQALPGEQQIDLVTGSRLSVHRVVGRGPIRHAPIVVLHGGPGIPDLEANTAVFAPLADTGADVYLYAQVGTDGSSRLADPRGYGLDRDAADLEGLRARLGLDRMVLIGHSYGANLAAAYLAAHPEHVERLVLLSPGALAPDDDSGGRATAGLGADRRLQLYSTVLAPRPLLGYALLQVNPSAAHAFLPDAEADARNDQVLNLARAGLYCAGPPPGSPPVRGSGFYAMQYPQSATASDPVDLRPRIAGQPTPALIVKGGCDYLSWRSALDFRDALPRSQLLFLPDAGHNLQQEQPEAVRAAINAFLLDEQPVPGLLLNDSRAAPAGYRGPP